MKLTLSQIICLVCILAWPIMANTQEESEEFLIVKSEQRLGHYGNDHASSSVDLKGEVYWRNSEYPWQDAWTVEFACLVFKPNHPSGADGYSDISSVIKVSYETLGSVDEPSISDTVSFHFSDGTTETRTLEEYDQETTEFSIYDFEGARSNAIMDPSLFGKIYAEILERGKFKFSVTSLEDDTEYTFTLAIRPSPDRTGPIASIVSQCNMARTLKLNEPDS